MIAVIFEAQICEDNKAEYLDLAAELLSILSGMDGFISVERFQSLTTSGKVLSLSFWRDESAVAQWRALAEHRRAQVAGRNHIFTNYRLRVAGVLRDYGKDNRNQTPDDSSRFHI